LTDERLVVNHYVVSVSESFASGYLLPVAAYTEQAWFDREQRDLFGQTWQFVAMADDLDRTGDFVTSDIGSSPLVVVRGENGALRAFHNLCRHRGARLFEGTGNAGRDIKCFYHAWSYGFDGALKRVPQADQFPNLDVGCMSLHPASVATWKGMVFVHPDRNAEPLASWLGEFPACMGPYEPEELVEISRDRFEVQANWKLFVENHIDGYHLRHLHSKSVVGFDHRHQKWEPIGRHWTFREPPQRPGESPTAALGLPPISGLPDSFLGSSVHLLFPNLGIASGAEYWLTLHMVPIAPDCTMVEVRTRTMPLPLSTKAGLAAQETVKTIVTAADRRMRNLLRRPDGSHPPAHGQDQITAEDARAAESIQRAMRSPMFSVGAMARDYESSISEFQRNVMHYVSDIDATR
jgi:phenylpropionate dioxygenase-like ring-hydroxylating dioxygenase large terminal subunit